MDEDEKMSMTEDEENWVSVPIAEIEEMVRKIHEGFQPSVPYVEPVDETDQGNVVGAHSVMTVEAYRKRGKLLAEVGQWLRLKRNPFDQA